MIQKLGDEKTYRQLVWLRQQRLPGTVKGHVAQTVQLLPRAHVALDVEEGEGLEILLLHLGADSLAKRHQKRQTAMLAGEHVDYQTAVAIT